MRARWRSRWSSRSAPACCSGWCRPSGHSASISAAAWLKAGAHSPGHARPRAPAARWCSRRWPWPRCCWLGRRCCSEASWACSGWIRASPSHGILTARVTLPRSRYDDPAHQVAFADALLDRARTLPGVTAAALGTGAPVDDALSYWAFAIAGVEQPPPEVVQDAVVYRATAEYFRTFDLPLIRGRLFEVGDRADRTPVAVVSQGLAQRYWPGRDPLGSRITFGDPADSAAVWMTVVGVVGDVRQDGAVRPAYPQIYVPFAQVSNRSIVVALRTGRNPLALAAPLKQALAGVDPGLALSQVTTMEQRVASTLARPRVNALLLGAFAATALVLAALGIYGVIAYSVVQRTRELGIRVALGASADAVLGMVMRQGLTPVLIGLAIGLGVAAVGSRVLRSLLYGVTATDLATYAAVAAFLTAVAVAASYVPARRAARSDPVKALRAE